MQVMPVNQPLIPLQPVDAGKDQEAGADSFSGILNRALQQLNDAQVKAGQLTVQLVTGEIQDVHQVTVALTEARLAMQLAVEVRNKIVEAYQEISRMQI